MSSVQFIKLTCYLKTIQGQTMNPEKFIEKLQTKNCWRHHRVNKYHFSSSDYTSQSVKKVKLHRTTQKMVNKELSRSENITTGLTWYIRISIQTCFNQHDLIHFLCAMQTFRAMFLIFLFDDSGTGQHMHVFHEVWQFCD